MDRKLIADLLEAQIGRRFKNKEEAARLSRIGRQTLYRVLSGDENVQESTIRRVEQGLDLPNGALFSIADHDLESAIALGTPTDIVEWSRRICLVSMGALAALIANIASLHCTIDEAFDAGYEIGYQSGRRHLLKSAKGRPSTGQAPRRSPTARWQATPLD